MTEQVKTMAEQAGLNYNFEDMKLTDTFPAHRVFQYAKTEGKGYEFFDKMYEAYFLEGELIDDTELLVQIGTSIGLEESRINEILSDAKEFDAEVVNDIFEASQIGVQGVPFFVFNNKYAVSGAQPVEAFEQVLNQVYEEFSSN